MLFGENFEISLPISDEENAQYNQIFKLGKNSKTKTVSLTEGTLDYNLYSAILLLEKNIARELFEKGSLIDAQKKIDAAKQNAEKYGLKAAAEITAEHKYISEITLVYKKALELSNTQKFVEAIKVYDSLDEKITQYPEIQTLLDSAVLDCRLNEAERLIKIGNSALKNNNYKQALDKYLEASKFNPDIYDNEDVSDNLETCADNLFVNESDRAEFFISLGEYDNAFEMYLRNGFYSAQQDVEKMMNCWNKMNSDERRIAFHLVLSEADKLIFEQNNFNAAQFAYSFAFILNPNHKYSQQMLELCKKNSANKIQVKNTNYFLNLIETFNDALTNDTTPESFKEYSAQMPAKTEDKIYSDILAFMSAAVDEINSIEIDNINILFKEISNSDIDNSQQLIKNCADAIIKHFAGTLAIDKDGKIYQYKNDKWNEVELPKLEKKRLFFSRFKKKKSEYDSLKNISIGADGTIFAITGRNSFVISDKDKYAGTNDVIYQWVYPGWKRYPGRLTQISVGDKNNIWGVNAADDIFKWDGKTWQKIAGKLKMVSVGNDGEVWGSTDKDNIYRLNADKWEKISGKLDKISVGNKNNIWGVSDGDAIYKWNGGGWTKINEKLNDISASGNGDVWGINASGNVYKFNGNSWDKITDMKFKVIDCQ